MLEAIVSAPPKPSAREVKLIHEVVKNLTQKLFRDRFGREPEPWDHMDDFELDRFLTPSKYNPWPTIAEVEALLRNRFASDGISEERPYQWIKDLGKYRPGALGKNGVPKSQIETQRAEAEAEFAAAVREVAERKRADAAADRDAILARLMMKVAEDLRSRGFDVFRPISHVSHLVAMQKSVNARNAPAIRIVVRASTEELMKNTDFYQAVVSPDQDLRLSPVVYHPPLETE